MAKILIVDDEPDILTLLRYFLERKGHDVHTAVNGLRGLEEARSFQPDLILLNMAMPVLHGVEVCRRLRHEPVRRRILMTTAGCRAAEFEAAMASGAMGFLFYPVDLKRLGDAVDDALACRLTDRELQTRADLTRVVFAAEQHGWRQLCRGIEAAGGLPLDELSTRQLRELAASLGTVVSRTLEEIFRIPAHIARAGGAYLPVLAGAETAVEAVERLFEAGASRASSELLATALTCRGAALGGVGLRHKAIAELNEVVRRFGGRKEDVFRLQTASAFLHKARLHQELNQHVTALRTLTALYTRFRCDREPPVRAVVSRGLVRTGALMDKLGLVEPAIRNCEVALRMLPLTYGRSSADETISALSLITRLLSSQKRFAEALSVCAQVRRRNHQKGWLDSARIASEAFLQEGRVRVLSRKPEEAFTAYSEALRRCARSKWRFSLRETEAMALYERGILKAAREGQ